MVNQTEWTRICLNLQNQCVKSQLTITVTLTLLCAFCCAVLSDPYGILSDWDTNPDCCTWLQSRAYRVTTCNSQGRVTSLKMGKALEYKPGPVYFKASSGEYAPSLGNLTYLQKLDLETIYSSGHTVPATWSNLVHLSNVTLDVLLGGPLPGTVVKHWPLKWLNLANNELNGTIPSELCKSSLKTLELAGNSFSGQIPSCLSRFPATSFGPTGNVGLCGAPLTACK